ncbi:MAG: hypothetical protein BWY67_00241 [Bacteroidetes bacterium ADurb.Bin397]|nr:MAG: hypothetical protein BWY67_00241 [Bacteroidetes bacterium ADurb.Bin397]
MKSTGLFLIVYFYVAIIFAQSPFDYGKNKQIYFLSGEERDSLGIEEITSVLQLPENDRGGMGENWDVTVVQFSPELITDDWYPISMPATFKYNFDSLVADMKFLNGSRYELSDGMVGSYGGGGYGSFDWKDIERYGDSISIIATSCVGHCGDQPVRFSKNVFNDAGLLLYSVNYPTTEGSDMFPEEKLSLSAMNEILMAGVNEENYPDTIFYNYTKSGLFIKPEEKNIQIESIKSIFVSESHFNYKEFQQCYIGKIEMEKFISKKLRLLPELLLIEIYRYGVFSFALNPANKKYYRTGTLELEQ